MSTRASYIRVDSKAEQLALLIGRAMDTGAIAPGEHLGTKRQLLDQYEVALGTLNEALRLLSSRGYIELRSGPRERSPRSAPIRFGSAIPSSRRSATPPNYRIS